MTDINDNSQPPEESAPVKKRRGRPPGRAIREPLRAAAQAPLRPTEFTEDGRAVAYSSSGERLTRKRSANVDPFYIDPSEIPEGMSYQWNRVSVVGEPDVDHQVAMRENGWRPVPASRHASKFMPENYSPNAPIERGGLRLEERPAVLTEEARAEELDKAQDRLRGAQEGLGLTQKMPNGFSRENDQLRRMERSGTSRSYAPAPDAPRPRLPIESS